MNKSIKAVLFVIIIASIMIAACERPAPVGGATTPTSAGEIPFPVSTTQQPLIMQDILSSTQTAAAIQGTLSTGGLATGATSTPAFIYATTTPGGLTTPISLYTSVPAATATPTRIAYPTPTPGRPSTYSIQSGEFPFCIARRFNVDIAELLSLNGLNVNSEPAIGTVLKIPQSGSWTSGERALKSHPTNYTVVSGDTLGSIACGFGDADPNTILAANGLTAGTALKVGQILYIP